MSIENIGDIPDLSGLNGGSTEEFAPFEDGWYVGTVNEKRVQLDKSGNERIFISTDDPSARGDSRNIKLQVTIKRHNDGRTLNISYLLNYRPEDLTTEMIQRVSAQNETVKNGGEWGDLFRPFMTLTRLSKLQKIAGVRQFQRGESGGLNLAPLYGKTAYFRLRPDDRNPQYKQISDVRNTAPKSNVF